MSSVTVKGTHLLDDTRKKRDEYLNLTTPKARLITAWDINAFAEKIDEARDSIVTTGSQTSGMTIASQDGEEVPVKKFNTTWMTQFRVLLHRSLKNSKSKILTPINIVKSVCLGFFAGMLWLQMPNTAKYLNDRTSFLFFATTYWTFDGMFSALFTFPLERSIIFKERASGSYHISAYFLSKTFSSLPSQLSLPVMFWIIAYWMANVNENVGTFFAVVCIALISNLAGESFGLLCGATVLDFQKAMAVMTVVALSLMAAGGFYIKNIPSFLQWVKYISPFKPSFEAAQILVFSRGVECDGSDVLSQYCTEGVEYATSEQVLEYLGSEGTVGLHIVTGVLLVLIPRYLAFLALKSKKGEERS
mmetsp:Transcript_13572/g.19848  ORF Transcript_13572/g.19848 Transcript_13572/m.19848 type:complete len:361 (+) Transcript_13572:2-1084(+)